VLASKKEVGPVKDCKSNIVVQQTACGWF